MSINSITLYVILDKTIKLKNRLLTYECKHRQFLLIIINNITQITQITQIT